MTHAAVSLPDPYTPGQTARHFAGRGQELTRIRDSVGRVVAFGEMGGPLLCFHAPRGIGKTSLLREAQRQADAAGLVTAWVACSRAQPMLGELSHSIERALTRADALSDGRAAGRYRASSKKLSVELGIPGARVRGEWGVDRGAEQDRSVVASAPIGACEDMLRESAILSRTRGSSHQPGAGLVVFIDELHAASTQDLGTLLNALQNLDGDPSAVPLTVVTAGLPVTPDAVIAAATFGERSAFFALDVLSDDDARALLSETAAIDGVTWREDALEYAVAECDGHPHLLQLLGSTVWRSVDPDPGGVLTDSDVAHAIPLVEERLATMYRSRWTSASKGEQAFIVAMATVATDGGNVARAQIASELGVRTSALSVPRERLIAKGVIEPVGHGLVRFTVPGFARWVHQSQ